MEDPAEAGTRSRLRPSRGPNGQGRGRGPYQRDAADTAVELEWYNNRLNSAPKPSVRIAPSRSAAIDNYCAGTPTGWYAQMSGGVGLSGLARYWDGSMWTLLTMPIVEAKQMIRQEFLATTAEGREQKSRVTAGLLAIFLGSLGVHRFYLGNKGVGNTMIDIFVVLVFFAAFWLVTIWGIVGGVMILCTAKLFDRDATGVPLNSHPVMPPDMRAAHMGA